jgi:hypothetical protein
MLRYDNITNFTRTNVLMARRNFSVFDLDNMIPWERELYVLTVIKIEEDEEERRKSK